jgi:hypothetical protein
MSTYEPIASQTVGTATPSITFSSLPQNYTDLILVINGSFSSTDNSYGLRFNGDTGNNYSTTTLYGDGTGSGATFRTTSVNKLYVGRANTSNSTSIIQIQNYSNASTYKTTLSRGGSSDIVMTTVGTWQSTSAINSLTIAHYDFSSTPTIAAGSTLTIYGVAVGNSSAKASGGNIVTTDGSYWYHAFTTSGTFIPSSALSADVLVVAGGGSGGGGIYGGSGGGGAGGLSYQAGRSLLANTSYLTIVGAGAASAQGDNQGNNGNNSIFDTITSIGGGGGGHYDLKNTIATAGSSGGSGGGSYDNQSGGASTQTNSGGATGYGNAGGIGRTYVGGGGGGAGAVGGNGAGNGSFDAAGIGGNGLSTYSSWGAATNTGHNVSGTRWYAGGGSGGFQNNASAVGVSNGGGGAGTSGATAPGNGLTNTGGGGGGTERGSAPYASGAGGSGIVIIRYAV